MTLIYNNHHRYRYDIICITQLFITNLLYTNIIIYSFFLIKIVMLEYYFFWTTSFSVPCSALPPEDLAFFNQVSIQKSGHSRLTSCMGSCFCWCLNSEVTCDRPKFRKFCANSSHLDHTLDGSEILALKKTREMEKYNMFISFIYNRWCRDSAINGIIRG